MLGKSCLPRMVEPRLLCIFSVIFGQWRRQWLMPSKPKRIALSDIRCTVSVFICEAGEGGYSVRCWVGVCHRTLKPFLSAPHTHAAYTIGVLPPGFEVFCIWESRSTGTILFNVTSNALFFVVHVWQDFVRFVVQRLLSRGANFHNSKHFSNYTQDGFVNVRFKYERRGRNEQCVLLRSRNTL